MTKSIRMLSVKPKKHLGQHFLTDLNIARKIAESLTLYKNYKTLLEIGPGTGILTQFIINSEKFNTYLIEIDTESCTFLTDKYPEKSQYIIHADFLKYQLPDNPFTQPYAIIGNFPYNISSQILFKVFENRDLVPEVVGMFQKEVAERIVSKPGSKKYGILSVLLQAYYNIEYLFSVSEGSFFPPPKVKSAVIRMKRNNTLTLNCDESLFVDLVKKTFNQRRKVLRNSIKGMNYNFDSVPEDLMAKRPEQLFVEDFVLITSLMKPTNF